MSGRGAVPRRGVLSNHRETNVDSTVAARGASNVPARKAGESAAALRPFRSGRMHPALNDGASSVPNPQQHLIWLHRAQWHCAPCAEDPAAIPGIDAVFGAEAWAGGEAAAAMATTQASRAPSRRIAAISAVGCICRIIPTSASGKTCATGRRGRSVAWIS